VLCFFFSCMNKMCVVRLVALEGSALALTWLICSISLVTTSCHAGKPFFVLKRLLYIHGITKKSVLLMYTKIIFCVFFSTQKMFSYSCGFQN